MTAAADRAVPALCRAEAQVVLGEVGFGGELGTTVSPTTS